MMKLTCFNDMSTRLPAAAHFGLSGLGGRPLITQLLHNGPSRSPGASGRTGTISRAYDDRRGRQRDRDRGEESHEDGGRRDRGDRPWRGDDGGGGFAAPRGNARDARSSYGDRDSNRTRRGSDDSSSRGAGGGGRERGGRWQEGGAARSGAGGRDGGGGARGVSAGGLGGGPVSFFATCHPGLEEVRPQRCSAPLYDAECRCCAYCLAYRGGPRRALRVLLPGLQRGRREAVMVFPLANATACFGCCRVCWCCCCRRRVCGGECCCFCCR